MSRPSKYTQKLADDICRQLVEGQSLRTICKKDEMPSKSTVLRWLLDDRYKDFWDQYARAREIQAEMWADEIIDIADDGSNDYMERLNEDGEVVGVFADHEHIQRSRLRVDTRKWVASKLLAKKFGDRVEVSGEVNHNHKAVDQIDFNANIKRAKEKTVHH